MAADEDTLCRVDIFSEGKKSSCAAAVPTKCSTQIYWGKKDRILAGVGSSLIGGDSKRSLTDVRKHKLGSARESPFSLLLHQEGPSQILLTTR